MYALLLCLKYLQTRFLAFVCIVSVMLGVATLIVVNSVMSGFASQLMTKLHGTIDTESAQSLMCRPVAMESNLHNVLFVPADGVLYVANADHKSPAAERPYVRLDLNELLQSMKPAAAASGPGK